VSHNLALLHLIATLFSCWNKSILSHMDPHCLHFVVAFSSAILLCCQHHFLQHLTCQPMSFCCTWQHSHSNTQSHHRSKWVQGFHSWCLTGWKQCGDLRNNYNNLLCLSLSLMFNVTILFWPWLLLAQSFWHWTTVTADFPSPGGCAANFLCPCFSFS